MIRRLLRAFLSKDCPDPVKCESPRGLTARLRAREAKETEGERERSSGDREIDMTEEEREESPSLTPPPRTVTLPPSYGVTAGVAETTVPGLTASRGVLGDGVRPREAVGVGVWLLLTSLLGRACAI